MENSIPVQYDIFTDITICELKAEVEAVKKSNNAVRKGLFARNTALDKQMIELEDKVAALDRELYRIKVKVYEDKEPEIHEHQREAGG